MKQIRLVIVLLIAFFAVSCAKKKQTTDIIVPRTETPKPQGPIRMQPYDQTKDVVWLGKNYQVAIKREADDSLKMVKDENGQEFIDNRIPSASSVAMVVSSLVEPSRRLPSTLSSTMTIVRRVFWRVSSSIKWMAIT